MARTKSEAIELLENRIRELQEENEGLVNDNENLNETLSRIGILSSEYVGDDDEEDEDEDEDEDDDYDEVDGEIVN